MSVVECTRLGLEVRLQLGCSETHQYSPLYCGTIGLNVVVGGFRRGAGSRTNGHSYVSKTYIFFLAERIAFSAEKVSQGNSNRITGSMTELSYKSRNREKQIRVR